VIERSGAGSEAESDLWLCPADGFYTLTLFAQIDVPGGPSGELIANLKAGNALPNGTTSGSTLVTAYRAHSGTYISAVRWVLCLLRGDLIRLEVLNQCTSPLDTAWVVQFTASPESGDVAADNV
jgi:hypothetical protein